MKNMEDKLNDKQNISQRIWEVWKYQNILSDRFVSLESS